MSEEKVQEKKEVKSDGKLEKQVASIAYTVRKMKDWLEEKMGADIDGDGRIGSGPYKKALVFLLIAGMASFCMAEDRTAIAYWSSKAKITSDGFVGDAIINSLTINNATVRTNASGILKADGAGLVSAASAGTDYLAPNTVWGYPGLATVTNLLENTVTATAKDTAGATLAGYRLFHVWVSTTDKGAATTNNIETLVLSTGTAISTVTANADYWYCSAVGGTAVATVTATAAGTNYLMVADGSSISSIALVETE